MTPFDCIGFMGDSVIAACPLERYLKNTINAGVNGQETSQMYARISADISQKQPYAAVIPSGINDIEFYSNPSINYISLMATSVRGNGIKCVLGTLPPAKQTTNRPNTSITKVKTWNDAIVSWARENRFPYADFYNAFLMIDGSPNWSLFIPESNGEPSVHPTVRGYDAWMNTLLPILERI